MWTGPLARAGGAFIDRLKQSPTQKTTSSIPPRHIFSLFFLSLFSPPPLFFSRHEIPPVVVTKILWVTLKRGGIFLTWLAPEKIKANG